MGDMREVFKDMQEAKKERKASNLKKNMDYLNATSLDYKVFNQGRQLNFEYRDGVVAFYPTTNKLVFKGKTYHGDARELVRFLKERSEPPVRVASTNEAPPPMEVYEQIHGYMDHRASVSKRLHGQSWEDMVEREKGLNHAN
jgi:hypothetical protein